MLFDFDSPRLAAFLLGVGATILARYAFYYVDVMVQRARARAEKKRQADAWQERWRENMRAAAARGAFVVVQGGKSSEASLRSQVAVGDRDARTGSPSSADAHGTSNTKRHPRFYGSSKEKR